MGAIRITGECIHCKSYLLLKFQVESIGAASINIYCPKCKTKIYGTFYEEKNKIELNNFNESTDEGKVYDYTILHASYFPTVILEGEYKLTPFFYFLSLFEMNPSVLKKNYLFMAILQNKELLLRINDFYSNGNYESLDKELILIDFISENKLNKEKAIARYNEMFFLPIFVKQRYSDLINNYKSFILKNSITKIYAVLNRIISNVNLIFKEYIRFIESFIKICPVLMIYIPISEIKDVPKNLGFYNIDDNLLKQFYMNIFELNCKILPIFKEVFLISETMPATDLSKFDNPSNGTKIRILSSLSKEFRLIAESLDSDLRNKIGHNAARLDLIEQKIITNLDNQRKDYSLMYLYQKCLENMELFFANLYFLLALKSIYAYSNKQFRYESRGCHLGEESSTSLGLELNFIDFYDSSKALLFDFKYWDILDNYVSEKNKIKINIDEKNKAIKLSLHNIEILEVSKEQNSRWYRLALKKGIKLSKIPHINKIPLYNKFFSSPIKNSPFNMPL